VSSWIKALGSAPQVGDNQAGVRGARLLGTTIGNYKITAELEQQLSQDKLAQMKDVYNKEGVERNNAFYGYVGKKTV